MSWYSGLAARELRLGALVDFPGDKSPDEAMKLQADYAKSAYETFVAESKKISELYTDFAKQTFKPFEGLIAKMTPAK